MLSGVSPLKVKRTNTETNKAIMSNGTGRTTPPLARVLLRSLSIKSPLNEKKDVALTEDLQGETPPKQPLNPHAKGFRHGCFAGCLFMIGGWFASIMVITAITTAKLQTPQDPDASFRLGEEMGELYAVPITVFLILGGMIVFAIFYAKAMRKKKT